MSIQEVINSGNFDLQDTTFIQILLSPEFLKVLLIVIIGMVVVGGLLVGLFYVSFGKMDDVPTEWISIIVGILGAMILLSAIFQTQKELMIANYTEYEQKKENWMSSQVTPFIDALPTTKVTARPLKIILDDSSTSLSASALINTTTDHNAIQNQLQVLKSTTATDHFSKVSVMYEEKGQIVTETQYMQIRPLPKKSNSSSYMTYQLLTNDLGHEVTKGKYNTTIYLPLDYGFE